MRKELVDGFAAMGVSVRKVRYEEFRIRSGIGLKALAAYLMDHETVAARAGSKRRLAKASWREKRRLKESPAVSLQAERPSPRESLLPRPGQSVNTVVAHDETGPVGVCRVREVQTVVPQWRWKWPGGGFPRGRPYQEFDQDGYAGG